MQAHHCGDWTQQRRRAAHLAAAAADAADVPAATAPSTGSSGESDSLEARVAHIYRIEGLGTLRLEGTLPGAVVAKP